MKGVIPPVPISTHTQRVWSPHKPGQAEWSPIWVVESTTDWPPCSLTVLDCRRKWLGCSIWLHILGYFLMRVAKPSSSIWSPVCYPYSSLVAKETDQPNTTAGGLPRSLAPCLQLHSVCFGHHTDLGRATQHVILNMIMQAPCPPLAALSRWSFKTQFLLILFWPSLNRFF